jgi:hypothetical protein
MTDNKTNYQSNTIIFITAFKNINRGNWLYSSRPLEFYIMFFLNLAMNIEHKLVVYVENEIANILKSYPLNNNIEIQDYSLVDTFYNRYIENERKMINSEAYKSKIPENRKTHPEHLFAEYNLVNHNKINFVAYTKQIYPQYEYYSWIDFGCIRESVNEIPGTINFSKLHKKISFLAFSTPSEKISANDMLKSFDIYLAGSQYVVHNELVTTYEKLYGDILEKWKTDIICDDDQNVNLQIYYEHKELFELFISNEWFSLFKNHLNQIN